MALTLPFGKVSFKTGTYTNFNKLSASQKTVNTLFLINNSEKLYLYSGANPVYSLVDTASVVSGTSNKPVTSSAVYDYINDDANKPLIYAGAGITPEVFGTSSMLKGKFYYFDDGTLKFQYKLGVTPITIQPKLTIDSNYSKDGTNPINGLGVFKGLKTIFEVVSALPAKGTAGITEKIYCVTKDNKSDLYFFPTATGEAVKINFDANSLTNVIVSIPVGDSQTISKTLKLNGNVQIASSQILNVDTIKKSSTVANSKLQFQDDVLFTNIITAQENATFNKNIEVKGTLTSNVGTIKTNLTVSGNITNTNIFSTTQKTSSVAPQFILNTATEFHFGSGYYLKPAGIKLPGGDITGSLNLGSSSSSHIFQGTFTFNNGSIYISNAKTVSNTTFNNPALVIGANSSAAKHLEIGLNGLQAKEASSANTTLSLNPFGGEVFIGIGGLLCKGNATFNNTVYIPNDLMFKDKTLSSIIEGKGTGQSGSEVEEVKTRLIYDGQQLLTKADVINSKGLVKVELTTLNNDLTQKITTNQTALNELIVIKPASSTYTGPTSDNTKIWIDTSLGTDNNKGVLKIKNQAGVWMPIASIWAG